MKIIVAGLLFSYLCVFDISSIAQDRFSQYRKISVYEVRPGIWALPRYNAANQICEIGIQRLFYSPDIVAVNPELSRDEILSVLEELVPATERGVPGRDLDNWVVVDGRAVSKNFEYEKVSITIFEYVLPNQKKKDLKTNQVAATVSWKNRPCSSGK